MMMMMTGGRGTRSGAVSAHAGLHKKKGLAGDLRVRLAQEKAVGRRERRATIVAERRGCNPLAERNTNTEARDKVAEEQSFQLIRKERLVKYKAEKEQRRRQELSKTLRPTFVVKHVKASPPRFLLSLPPGVTIAPPAVAKKTTTMAASRVAAAQPRKAAPRVAPPAQDARPVVRGRAIACAGATGRMTRLRAKEEMVVPTALATRHGARIAIKADEVLHEEELAEKKSVDESEPGEEPQSQQERSRTPKVASTRTQCQGSGRRSFAPVGFMFQGLPGIVAMPRLQPLSPRSTSSFLAPVATIASLSFSPVQHGPPLQLPPVPANALELKAVEDAGVELAPEGQDGVPGVGNVAGPGFVDAVTLVPVAGGAVEAAVGPVAHGEELHGVSYYRSLLREETARLMLLCEKWEGVNLVEELPEEMSGRVRTAVGMARLLMAKKLCQFKGLVDDCDLGRGEKVTTVDDVAGFWDMVYFQVEGINNMFAELEKLQGAGWKQELILPAPKPIPAKKKAAATAAAATAVAAPLCGRAGDGARRAAARKRLAACRAAVVLARGAGEHCKQGEASPSPQVEASPPQQVEASSPQQVEASPPQQVKALSPQQVEASPPQQVKASPPQQVEASPRQKGEATPLQSPTTLGGPKRSRGGCMTPSVTVAFKEGTPRESRRPLRKTPRPTPVPPSPDTPDSPLRCREVEQSQADNTLHSENDVDELEWSISKYLVPSRARTAHIPEHGPEKLGEEGEEEDAGAREEFLIPLPSHVGLLSMWRTSGSHLTTPCLGSASPLTTASCDHLSTPPVKEEPASTSNLIIFTPDATDDEVPSNDSLGSILKRASVASAKKIIRGASGVKSPLLSPVRRSLRLEGRGTHC